MRDADLTFVVQIAKKKAQTTFADDEKTIKFLLLLYEIVVEILKIFKAEND